MGSTITGATIMGQLKENIDAAEIALSTEVGAAIDAIHARMTNPSQEGFDIPACVERVGDPRPRGDRYRIIGRERTDNP